MPAINLYFEIHQPYRLRRYTVFDLGQNSFYEDDDRNCDMLLHAARNCYLPMNDVLLRCIAKHGKDFKVSFSISGIALEQFEQYAPEVIDSFKALAATGCVEFMGETYAHSLASIYSKEEFARQVRLHSAKIRDLFGKSPKVFRNTQLIYDNVIARDVEELGFKGIVAEGADHILGWRSPNYVYEPIGRNKIKLLLNNYPLTDNITLRFGDRQWDQWPLTTETFASWCFAVGSDAQCINIFMNYETFGLAHPADTGIFQFMEHLPAAILANKAFSFKTVSEVIASNNARGVIDVPTYVSWRDAERDLNIWLGNDMQKDAIHALYDLEPAVTNCKSDDLQQTWLRLQTAEHFAYMCTKWFSNDAVSPLPSTPYPSPYDAYINYMNVLADFSLNVQGLQPAPAGQARTAGASKKAAVKKAGGQPTVAQATAEQSAAHEPEKPAKSASVKASSRAPRTSAQKTSAQSPAPAKAKAPTTAKSTAPARGKASQAAEGTSSTVKKPSSHKKKSE